MAELCVAGGLPAADRIVIETVLGQGALGPSAPAPVIYDPARYFKLAPVTRRFKVVHEPDSETLQIYRIYPAPGHSGRSGWRYQTGNEEAGFLEAQADGSLVVTGVEDLREEAVTRYDPPELFLPKGIVPGEERQMRMAVSIYPPGNFDHVIHRGELWMTYHYLGACRLTVPAGTFEVVIMKSTLRGQVGPASLEDVQYRFFAIGIGLLASIENRYVSAFMLYQSDTRVSRVLVGNIH